MRIEQIAGATRSPLYRLRLTFGALRGSGVAGRTPMVIVLPWHQPGRDNRCLIHLDAGERVSLEAARTVSFTVRAGGSVVFACASLPDATVTFGDLAAMAGYAVADAR